MYIFNIKRYAAIFLLSLSVFLFSKITYAQNFLDKPFNEKTSKITKPQSEDISVLVWANEAVVSAYSYNFVNYKQQLEETSQYFTSEGWSNFKSILEKSDNLKALVKKKWIVSAVATDSPVIINKGIEKGKYTWHVQIPLLITWQSSKDHIQSHAIINMRIIKMSNEIRDFAIDAFAANFS